MPETTTITRPDAPTRTTERELMDPSKVREPEKWCDQQKREFGVEAAP